MGTYLLVRFELFWQQACNAFAPLNKFSALFVMLAGQALLGLMAPLVLLGFQLFNPELGTVERWPYLQMLLVILFCWQGGVAWQQKPVAQQYFVESLAPSAKVANLSNTLMATVNQLPFWFLTLPAYSYLLLSGKTMAYVDAIQLLLVLMTLCLGFKARQTSWLALVAVFVLPAISFWSLPLLALMLLERAWQQQLNGQQLSAGSLLRYWLYWFIRQQQNKAMVLLIVFVLALWHYWLEQQLKPEAILFVSAVFNWILALLCYAQQKLWQQHLSAQHYFWLALCTTKQWLVLKLLNVLPVLLALLLALSLFDAVSAVCTIALAVALSFSQQLKLLSVASCCFILLVVLN